MNLKKKRKQAGMTQADLAERVGIRQCQICKIERGKSKPRIKTAKRIAKILKFKWTELYEEDDGQG